MEQAGLTFQWLKCKWPVAVHTRWFDLTSLPRCEPQPPIFNFTSPLQMLTARGACHLMTDLMLFSFFYFWNPFDRENTDADRRGRHRVLDTSLHILGLSVNNMTTAVTLHLLCLLSRYYCEKKLVLFKKLIWDLFVYYPFEDFTYCVC